MDRATVKLIVETAFAVARNVTAKTTNPFDDLIVRAAESMVMPHLDEILDSLRIKGVSVQS